MCYNDGAMFKRMNHRIYISLLSTAALLVTVIVTLSVLMVSDIISANYIEMAAQKLERSISRGKNYVESALLTAGYIASDASLIAELTAPSGQSFTAMLDNCCEFAMKTDAVTVYATDGRVYTSSGVADVPTLTELDADAYLHDFFTDVRGEDISMRTHAVARIYRGAAYDASRGIISCCKKVYRDGEVVGYIFSDIFPAGVYRYFDWSDEKYFSDSLPVIRQNGRILPYGRNGEYEADFAEARYARRKTADGRYLIMPGNRNFFGGSVSVAVPLAPLYDRVGSIGLLLSLVGIGVLTGAHFAAKVLAGSIDRRLTRLQGRMEKEGAGG